MLISDLDKQIIVQKEVTTKNAIGTPTESYEFLKETMANIKVSSGDTEYGDQGALPYTRIDFIVRYDERYNYKCRIKYGDQLYEFQHIEHLGRKHWMKIRTIVWEGETQNGQ